MSFHATKNLGLAICQYKPCLMCSVPGLRLLGPELVAVDPAPMDPDTLVDLIKTKVGKMTDRLKLGVAQ